MTQRSGTGIPNQTWRAPSAGKRCGKCNAERSRRWNESLRPPRERPYVFVSHGDVIRAILAHFLRLDLAVTRHATIDHVSVSGLELTDHSAQLLFLNHRPGVDRLL